MPPPWAVPRRLAHADPPAKRGVPELRPYGGGLPLTAVVTAANVNDTTMFEAVLDDIAPVRTPAGGLCAGVLQPALISQKE